MSISEERSAIPGGAPSGGFWAAVADISFSFSSSWVLFPPRTVARACPPLRKTNVGTARTANLKLLVSLQQSLKKHSARFVNHEKSVVEQNNK